VSIQPAFSYVFPLFRLSGRKVCERVKTKGLLWKGKHVHARYFRGMPKNLDADHAAGLFVGLVTSAKLDALSVNRNRMRRRVREALRLILKDRFSDRVKPFSSYQLLLLPRTSSLRADFSELLLDMEHLASFLSPPS
jgi:ribonuclease P protein component